MHDFPKALRSWFIFHFIIDLIFAVPLFLMPETFLNLLGWKVIDPFATRIVAAALFAIGIESWLGRNATLETYKSMLNLKIIWSGATVAGTVLAIYQTAYVTVIAEWLLLFTFLLFHCVWIFWRWRLSR